MRLAWIAYKHCQKVLCYIGLFSCAEDVTNVFALLNCKGKRASFGIMI